MKKPAAFLDRDGTIIIDKHYLKDPEQIEFLPNAIKALEILRDHGYEIFIVTNQSGVGRGLFNMKELEAIHIKLDSLLAEYNLTIKNYGICPHHPEDFCDCRKPSPKIILDQAAKYNIDLKKSFMAGDKDIDVHAGINANIKSYLVGKNDLLSIVKTHLSIKN